MVQVSEVAVSLQELGANFDVGEIPADLKDEAEEWHEKLVETAIEVDDAAMEAFFEGEVSGQYNSFPILHLPINSCAC